MKNILLLAILIPQLTFAMTGLKVGDKAPDISLKDTKGNIINFSRSTETVVAVFYRGAWCPYCIGQLKTVQSELVNNVGKDVKLIAISVDKLKKAQKMKKKFKFSFDVLSDSRARLLKGYKIINKLTPELVAKYKSSYKIDIEGDSGEKHHMIAHPAVFIVKNGKITFADVHEGYKDRTKNSDILNALK
jgi:peroxiredoxin